MNAHVNAHIMAPSVPQPQPTRLEAPPVAFIAACQIVTFAVALAACRAARKVGYAAGFVSSKPGPSKLLPTSEEVLGAVVLTRTAGLDAIADKAWFRAAAATSAIVAVGSCLR
jgi:hypothetical protein